MKQITLLLFLVLAFSSLKGQTVTEADLLGKYSIYTQIAADDTVFYRPNLAVTTRTYMTRLKAYSPKFLASDKLRTENNAKEDYTRTKETYITINTGGEAVYTFPGTTKYDNVKWVFDAAKQELDISYTSTYGDRKDTYNVKLVSGKVHLTRYDNGEEVDVDFIKE